MTDEIRRKTIQVKLGLTTGVSNFDICELVETALRHSILNSAPYYMVIEETKVTKDAPSYDRGEVRSSTISGTDNI